MNQHLDLDLQVDIEVRRGAFTLAAKFVAKAGTSVAVVGPNGSGKSTLVDALAGHLPIEDGSIALGETIWDQPSSDRWVAPEKRRVGLVHQRGLLFPHLSIANNVAFGLPRRPSSAQKKRLTEILGQFELVELAARKPAELSVGQAQRTAIARALAPNPTLILLDEPFANIDIKQRRDLRKVLKANQSTNQIQVVVTHGPDHTQQADWVVALEKGEVVAQGSPSDIRQHPTADWLKDLLNSKSEQ